MQPNKSVEEIEQLIKYFRGRTGGWGMVLDKSISEIEKDLRKNLQELLTSHTNTVLQGVVEKIKKSRTVDEVHGVGLKEETARNQVILDLLNDQIISNEK